MPWDSLETCIWNGNSSVVQLIRRCLYIVAFLYWFRNLYKEVEESRPLPPKNQLCACVCIMLKVFSLVNIIQYLWGTDAGGGLLLSCLCGLPRSICLATVGNKMLNYMNIREGSCWLRPQACLVFHPVSNCGNQMLLGSPQQTMKATILSRSLPSSDWYSNSYCHWTWGSTNTPNGNKLNVY